MNKILAGAASGLLATVPMTAAMLVMHRRLPLHQRYRLPPRKVTMNVATALGIKHQMSESQREAATIASHFGYGAAMGAIYGAFAKQVPVPGPAKGIAWGLIVWAGSYLGLLPAMDLHEPATQHPQRRNILMILAHVVWGATLGALFELHESLRRSPQRVQMGQRARKARPHRSRTAGGVRKVASARAGPLARA